MRCEVTIGIPVFQANDYIRETMLSALAQSYADVEFLIVDDCGADGSMTVVEELQETHPRGGSIRILRHPENKGVGASRKQIIREARGKYLYFMDSDDMIESDTIERLMAAMRQHEADVVYASYEKIDTINHTPTEQFQYPTLSFTSNVEFASYVFSHYGKFQVSVCNCLLSLDFLRCHHLTFVDAMFWEDMAFTYDMAMKVQKAALLPDITYHYICRPNSLSHYQDRDILCREEILKNVSTMDYLKRKCGNMGLRPYLPDLCYNLQMNSFYIVCHVLKHRRRITPPISDEELRTFMRHPLLLHDVLRFRHRRIVSLILWLLPLCPLPVFKVLVRMMGRIKKI